MVNGGFLDDRKKRILRAIIDDYIDTAEPVGSRTIAKKHELGFSSATIRNEMADLEEMGYLAQPHTSAGRVPSDKGYRLYVDHLMKVQKLSTLEMNIIRESMEIKMNELNQIIKQASMIISKITNYTSIVITPHFNRSTIKSINLIYVDVGQILVIVITNTGVVKNSLLRISEEITMDFLNRTASIINKKLFELTIEDVNLRIINQIQQEMGGNNEILLPILNEIFECINSIDNPELFVDGTTNILNHPEFKNVGKAKEFINILEKKKVLLGLLNNIYDDYNKNDIFVKIGNENQIDNIKNCSLITTPYMIGEDIVGTIGLIGPTRMEYSKVIATMDFVRNKINDEIKRLFNKSMEE